MNLMFPSRHKAERLVKRCHRVGLGNGNAPAFDHAGNRLSRQVPVLLLDILENTDERALLSIVPFNDLIYFIPIHFRLQSLFSSIPQLTYFPLRNPQSAFCIQRLALAFKVSYSAVTLSWILAISSAVRCR